MPAKVVESLTKEWMNWMKSIIQILFDTAGLGTSEIQSGKK